MDSKAIIFSVVAVLGTGGLIWAGLGGVGNEHRDREREEHERRHEVRGDERYSNQEHERVRVLQQQGDILSLEQILDNARRHHQGRVLEADLKHKHDRYVYEVELVDDNGHVWEMKFDAMSGDLLKEDRED